MGHENGRFARDQVLHFLALMDKHRGDKDQRKEWVLALFAESEVSPKRPNKARIGINMINGMPIICRR
jgi:hypothetical protein